MRSISKNIVMFLEMIMFFGFLRLFVLNINLAVESFRSLERNTLGQPENVVSLAKWRMLNRLHDRNETLYYRVSLALTVFFYLSHMNTALRHNSSSLQVLIDNIKDFAPIIYTPTVGLVCQNYSGLYRRPRGMYFSAKDKGEMMSMIYNWPAQQVDMIVITDGSRILGLGDLGVQGIGIPIGKLDMYVAAAGINPQRVRGSQHDRVCFFFFAVQNKGFISLFEIICLFFCRFCQLCWMWAQIMKSSYRMISVSCELNWSMRCRCVSLISHSCVFPILQI